MNALLLATAGIAGVLLAGCSSGSGGVTAGSEPEASPANSCTAGALGVGCWDDYAPSVKQRIDAAIAGKKCAQLQSEFDQAEANNEATMARLGHTNADLMGYIDQGMQQAGCYS